MQSQPSKLWLCFLILYNVHSFSPRAATLCNSYSQLPILTLKIVQLCPTTWLELHTSNLQPSIFSLSFYKSTIRRGPASIDIQKCAVGFPSVLPLNLIPLPPEIVQSYPSCLLELHTPQSQRSISSPWLLELCNAQPLIPSSHIFTCPELSWWIRMHHLQLGVFQIDVISSWVNCRNKYTIMSWKDDG